MLKSPLNSCIQIFENKQNIQSFNKNMTFSGYKKTQVFQQLKKSILKGEVDKACFWAAELDASSYTEEMWNKIMLFACKEINYANPNLPTYLYKSYRDFRRISYNWSKKEMCDSQELRNRLCEFICILSMSLKKKFPDYPRIKDADFKIKNMKKRMIATDTQFIQGLVNQNNTVEIRIALNEFANHLVSESGSTDSIKYCLFWLDWIAYYNKIYKKQMGKELKCIQMYKHSDVDPKYKANFVWYVWDIITSVLNILETRMTRVKFQFLKKNVENLGNLYKYEITKGNMNRRLIYVKYAILLMKKDISVETYEKTPCFTNSICIKACANVNDLYRYLLKNKKTYEYTRKEEELVEKIKELPSGVMTDEELTERIHRNNQNQQKEKEIANYFKNKKYGKEKLEEEMNRINAHLNVTNERHETNYRTANSIQSLKERKIQELEQEQERKRREYEKTSKRHVYKTNERIRQRKIQMNARRMYKNLHKL
jgi:hypothetical protein